jgi:hypothetical protein
MNIFMSILNWISGGLLEKITNPLLQAYRDKLAADTSDKKLDAERIIKQLELEQEQRNNAKEIRLATAGFPEMRFLTFLIALPFTIHLWLVAWDTWDNNINLHIPALPHPFDEWQGAILLSFFGATVIGSGIKAVAGAIAYKKK